MQHRLPAMYAWREFAEAGGLMAYGPNVADTLYRAASFVDRIIKGGNPAEMPIEQPTKFELVINLKTAKALGTRNSSRAAGARRRGDRVRLVTSGFGTVRHFAARTSQPQLGVERTNQGTLK